MRSIIRGKTLDISKNDRNTMSSIFKISNEYYLSRENSPFLLVENFVDNLANTFISDFDNSNNEYLVYRIDNEIVGFAFIQDPIIVLSKTTLSNSNQYKHCRLVKWLTTSIKCDAIKLGTALLNHILVEYSVIEYNCILFGYVHNSQSVTKFYDSMIKEDGTKLIKSTNNPDEFITDFVSEHFKFHISDNLKTGWICYWYPNDIIPLKSQNIVIILIDDVYKRINEGYYDIDKSRMKQCFGSDTLYASIPLCDYDSKASLADIIRDTIRLSSSHNVIIWHICLSKLIYKENYPTIKIRNEHISTKTLYDDLIGDDILLCAIIVDASEYTHIEHLGYDQLTKIIHNPWETKGTIIISSCNDGYSTPRSSSIGSYFTYIFTKNFNGSWLESYDMSRGALNESIGMEPTMKQIDFMQTIL